MPKSILRRLKDTPAPLIDGDIVTFIWHGDSPPQLTGDFTGWDEDHPAKMVKISPKIWVHQEKILPDAYIEYSFQQNGENVLDPYNPRKTPNGVSGHNNYFFMPDYQPSSVHKKKANIPHGMIHTHNISTEYYIPGDHRKVHLYQPPTNDPVPLVVIWDGQDYLHRIHLDNIVDNLTYKGKIKPLALAFIDNAGEDLRTVEYACSDATLAFLKSEVLPLAKRELNLMPIESSPGAYGVLGASMGGLMALYTGLRMPEIFGKVLSQSGAFTLGELDTVVFDLVRHEGNQLLKIWLDVGKYDLAGLLESNRKLERLFEKRGYTYTFREYHAGHNFPAWREDIWRGFEVLFGS